LGETGVVVENFSYVFTGPSSVTREEMRAFKKVWAEFDTERTGYLQLYKLDMFFSVSLILPSPSYEDL
jgi:hypothetical protein